MPAFNNAMDARNREESQDAAAGISLPLYIGGLVVTLAGVLSVSAAISVDGAPAMQATAVTLTLLGFAFSLACRHLNIQARLIDLGCLVFLVYLGYELITQRMDIGWFLASADQPDAKLAAGLMWLSVLRAWTLISDDLVMFSCVFTAAMIGLVGTEDVNAVIIVYFAIFVLAMTFLLIHQNYLQNRRLATPKDRIRSFGALIPAQMGLTALCGLAVLALGSALIAPAQALFANMSLATAIRGLVGNGSGHGDLAGNVEVTRFSDDASLDIGLGSIWPTSPDVLLHVAPSDQQPHYWLGRTYDQYLGTSWRSTRNSEVSVDPRADNGDWQRFAITTKDRLGEGHAPARPSRHLATTVEVHGDTDEFYYAGDPIDLIIPHAASNDPHAYADGRIDLNGQPVQPTYSIDSILPPDASILAVRERLRRDGSDYPAEVRRLYLQPALGMENNSVTTPEDVTQYTEFVNQALLNLKPGHRTQFDKAVAISDWVSARCTYSLKVAPIPPYEDSVRYFLSVSRRGYCDLFASSMVILCRAAGIPARLATGFAPGDRDASGFNLRALDKHAWVQVYFPGNGWQLFDPTVGSQTDGSVPRLHAKSVSIWAEISKRLTSTGLLGKILVAAILLAFAYIVKVEFFDRWRARQKRLAKRAQPLRHIEEGYAQLTRALARLGLPRRAWETPSEYESRAVPFLAAQESALGVPLPPNALVAVTKRFMANRYGGIAASADTSVNVRLSDFIRAAASARRIKVWRLLRRARPRLEEA